MQEIIYKELLEIADKKGIEVIEVTFKSITMKGLYIQNEEIKVIFLNKVLEDLSEKNFVLSHEIGHHDLHQGKINEALYFNDSDYRNKLEDEANNYANILIDKIKGEIGRASCRERV